MSESRHLPFRISITRVEHDSSGTSDPCLMVPPPGRGITPAPSKGTGIIPPAQSRAWGSALRNRRARTDEDGNKIATWYGKWGGRRTPPLEGSRSGARAFRRTGELCGIGWGEALEGGQLGSVHSALLRARGRNAVGLLAGGGVRVARFAPWPGHVLRVHGIANGGAIVHGETPGFPGDHVAHFGFDSIDRATLLSGCSIPGLSPVTRPATPFPEASGTPRFT